MSILSQIIAYSPNKIDTETKAQALSIGPRAMVGEITNEQTQFGRPIYQTPSGEKVSEKSTTLFLNGNWMNVPSIHGGKSFNEDELRLMIKQGNLQPTSVHKSKADAEAAAEARSNSMVQGPRNMADGGRIPFGKGGSGTIEDVIEIYVKQISDNKTTDKFSDWLQKNSPKNYGEYTELEKYKTVGNAPQKKRLEKIKFKILEDLVSDANTRTEIVRKNDLLRLIEPVRKETGMAKGVSYPVERIAIDQTSLKAKKYNQILKKLIKKEKKISNVIDNLIDGSIPLKHTTEATGRGVIYETILDQVGKFDVNQIATEVKKHPYFKSKKGQKMLDYLNKAYGNRPEFFQGWTLDELMEWSRTRGEGGSTLRGMNPNNTLQIQPKPTAQIYRWMHRHWDQNKFWDEKGKVEFFKKGSKKPIKWSSKTVIGPSTHDFSYNGKRYDLAKLEREYLNYGKGNKTPFNEFFKTHKEYFNFLNKNVPGTNKRIAELLFDAYGTQGNIGIDHIDGIMKDPMKNLRLMNSRMNSALGKVFYNYRDYPKIKTALSDIITKNYNVNDNYIDALAKNEIKLAKNILKNGNSVIPSYYSDAGKELFTSKNYKNFNPIERKMLFQTGYKPDFKQSQMKKILTEPTITKVFEKDQTGKATVKEINKLLKQFEARGCGKAAGGRILFAEGTPDGKITKCARQGIQAFIDDLKKGNYSKASLNILKGGGALLKGALNPMELLKIRNLIGPAALGFMAAYEGGVITDDVIRQGTPLNESLANNWLTRSFLPYTQDYAKAKNLLESGTVPSNMKKYVQDVVTFNESLKDLQGIENMTSSRIADVGGYGMLDGSSMYSKKQEDKDVNDLIKKMNTISEDVVTPGTAKALEMKSLQDEMEATRMAKKEFSPIFGFDKLKDVRTPGSTSFDYIPEETPKDFRPITYQDAEYEDKKLPLGLEQAYMNKFNIKPRDNLSNYFFKDSEKNVLEELTDEYNAFKRQEEASKYPGYVGTQEKFMEGGIASLNVKK